MRLFATVALLASFTLGVARAQVWPGIDSQAGDEIAARVLSMEGRVSLMRDGGDWALNVGDQVRVHQVILTGADGHATFRVADGSTFEVFPNSQVTFRANPGSWRDLLDVWLGKIRVHIQRPNGQPNPNRVYTPTAIISVRGTTFDVTVNDGDEATVVLVEEGSVAVEHRLMPRTEEAKILHAGDELTVHRNLPIEETRRFDISRTMRVAGDVLMQLLVRMPRISAGGGSSGGGIPLPGDNGGTAPTPPTPPKPPKK